MLLFCKIRYYFIMFVKHYYLLLYILSFCMFCYCRTNSAHALMLLFKHISTLNKDYLYLYLCDV